MEHVCAIILTLILGIHSARHYKDAGDQTARLEGVAQDICAEAQNRPIISGEMGPAASALALYAVAAHESGFWGKVQDCSACKPGSIWCDQGRSVTLYQLQGPVAWGPYDRQQLCESNARATERAASILRRHRKASDVVRFFRGYAGAPRRAAEMAQIFWVGARKVGVKVVSKDGVLQGISSTR